ncbi:MAG: BACON domain-containing protein, partial [Acidobacteriota bacterium]
TGGVQTAVTQNYGAVSAAGGTASRNFTFRVNSSQTCGSPVTLTWDLSDGSTSFGSISQSFATGTPILSLSQNFDGVTAPALPTNWSLSQLSGTGITWTTVTSSPVSSSPNVAFANGPATVNSAALESSAVPISTSNATMTFKKSFSLESGTTAAFDGAVLEIKIGTGNWQDIVTAGGSFVSGGYNMTISTSYSNPLGGRQAWSGSSTTFTTTQLTLPSSANGQTVRFRWIVATDSSTASDGFRLDDVQVSGGVQCYSCFQIGGAVKVGTVGLSSVSIALTGGGSSTVSTASDGTYSFASVLSGNNYTITPSRSGYYFTPASRSYTGLAADFSTQDFAASACTYSLGATSVNATASGGTGTLTVTPGNSACSWTAASNNTWITVTSGSSGTGSGTVGYSVAANTGTSRSGTITAGGQTFTINQAAASAPNRRQMDFDGDGKTDYSIFRPSGAAGAEWWYLKSGT